MPKFRRMCGLQFKVHYFKKFKQTNHKMHTSDKHKISIFTSDDAILNACSRVIGFDILIRPKTMKANMKVLLPSSSTNVHSKMNYDSITNLGYILLHEISFRMHEFFRLNTRILNNLNWKTGLFCKKYLSKHIHNFRNSLW